MPESNARRQHHKLIDRLKAQKCELCGATDNLVMHHVRKLGELKGKENWEKTDDCQTA